MGWTDGLPVIPRGACDPLAGMHAVFALMAAHTCVARKRAFTVKLRPVQPDAEDVQGRYVDNRGQDLLTSRILPSRHGIESVGDPRCLLSAQRKAATLGYAYMCAAMD